MRVIRTEAELREEAARLGRAAGVGGVLVPTMGALHAGHAALVRRGGELARELGHGSLRAGCVVSIFVNPTQFNQASDYNRYPRTLDADLEICEAAGAETVFAPEERDVYPSGGSVEVPPLPEVATEPGLEDRFRPGHFAGVCQVVMRLFRLLGPDVAVFGEKDWQQLQVVSAMTREASLPIRIVAHPTLRDPDRLAMSSRNRFLSAAEREAALAIPRALAAARSVSNAPQAERRMLDVLGTGLRVEYAVVRDAVSLRDRPASSGGRALIAAWAGGTRLIDNGPWT